MASLLGAKIVYVFAASISLARLYCCCETHKKKNQNDHWYSEMQTKQGASSALKHCEHGVKAYNNVAPEEGVVGHLLQAGQQPRQDSAAQRGQHLQGSRHPTSPASITCRAQCCSVHSVLHRGLTVLWCRKTLSNILDTLSMT